MVACWFRRSRHEDDWRAIKYLTLFSFVLVYASFLFTTKKPKAHTFYVFFPVIFVYSLYCWSNFDYGPVRKAIVIVFLITGILSQGAYALYEFRGRSLYERREVVAAAIDGRDYRLLGERRAGARY
jgi:hypothetical protein